MSNYNDNQLLIATQIGYLDYKGNGNAPISASKAVNSVLELYGTYNSSTGTYEMKPGVSGKGEEQFKIAQYITELAARDTTGTWENWSIVDRCDKNNSSGYYGCLIDTGDGGAIVACRGSESTNLSTGFKDWVEADVMRLNNVMTKQQGDATEYMQYLADKYGDKYDSFDFTGHSLGGSLATHMAITAPEKIRNKMGDVVSFDGPGFSDEYLLAHKREIERVNGHLKHYEYSWVGSLLFQPPGCDNRVIKAHDDPGQEGIKAQLYRHDTHNIELTNDGYVQDGERGQLQKILGPASKALEGGLTVYTLLLCPKIVFRNAIKFLEVQVAALIRDMNDFAEKLKTKMAELYLAYQSLIVSGEFEVTLSSLSQMGQDMESAKRELEQCIGQIRNIKNNLPYDSVAGTYYKNCLNLRILSLQTQSKNAGKIAKAADLSAGYFAQGDRIVADGF